MKVLYNPEQIRNLFAATFGALKRLDRDWRQVFDRDPRQSHDGYPVQSMGGSRRKGRHADPTQQVVLQLVDGGAVGSDVAKLFGLVHQAAELLEQADSLRARILPPEKKAEIDLSLWCQSCLRVGVVDHRGRHELVHTPARRDGAEDCWSCYRFKKAEGEWPPPVLIALRHAGRRVYEQTVKAAQAGELSMPAGYKAVVAGNGTGDNGRRRPRRREGWPWGQHVG